MGAWAAGLVLAPLLVPPGTVSGLDGRANFMDHPERWRTLDTFPALIYAVGDYVCHQMASRSWGLKGNQMPVDVRILAASIAVPMGLSLALRAQGGARARDMLASLLPIALRASAATEARRRALWLGGWLLALAPTAIDGGLELAGVHESVAGVRLATGFLLGGLASLLGALTWLSLWADPAADAPAPGPSR